MIISVIAKLRKLFNLRKLVKMDWDLVGLSRSLSHDGLVSSILSSCAYVGGHLSC